MVEWHHQLAEQMLSLSRLLELVIDREAWHAALCWVAKSDSVIIHTLYVTSPSLYLKQGKESACNTGDQGLIPRSESSFGEGNGKPVQYLCL